MRTIIKVALMNDNPIFRVGLNASLKDKKNIIIVGDFVLVSDLLIGLNKNDENFPDVLLLSSSLENQSELLLLRKLKTLFPSLKILLACFKRDYFYILNLIKQICDGILLNAQPSEVIIAIATLAKGDKFFSKEIIQKLNDGLAENWQTRSNQLLTSREQQIAHFIASGSSSKEIALALNISIRTIDCHRYNILTKLGLRNSAELVKVTNDFRDHFLIDSFDNSYIH